MTVALPLVPSIPNYRFGSVLAGRQYIFDVRWNTRDEAWYMDILTDQEEILRAGIKLVIGTVLGGPPQDTRFPRGILIATDTSGENRDATFDDLGVRVLVLFSDLTDIPSS